MDIHASQWISSTCLQDEDLKLAYRKVVSLRYKFMD